MYIMCQHETHSSHVRRAPLETARHRPGGQARRPLARLAQSRVRVPASQAAERDRGGLSPRVREQRRAGARRLGCRGIVARVIARGEVWTYRFKAPDKRRPMLILSRDDAIEVLSTVMVAPVTSTIRDLPSQVVIGATEGLDHDSAISLDHIQCVDRARLIRRLGRLSPERMREVCSALAVATGCG